MKKFTTLIFYIGIFICSLYIFTVAFNNENEQTFVYAFFSLVIFMLVTAVSIIIHRGRFKTLHALLIAGITSIIVLLFFSRFSINRMFEYCILWAIMSFILLKKPKEKYIKV